MISRQYFRLFIESNMDMTFHTPAKAVVNLVKHAVFIKMMNAFYDSVVY